GARLGLSICYDLRFPALYTALAQAGADLLAVPAAFTVPTGRAHWEVLLRARAIETGCFVAAAAQTGRHEDGRETWGHSLVVDPWGDVLLDMGVALGVATVDLELARVADARTRIPALASARPFAPPGPPRDAAA
ncbi:MAG: nitrilase-related carbon-nitrogen hydrolase, partial [Thermaurantiacus sp.]